MCLSGCSFSGCPYPSSDTDNGVTRPFAKPDLESLVLFSPDDTASNLDPGDRTAPGFPQKGQSCIALTKLFNDPTDKE